VQRKNAGLHGIMTTTGLESAMTTTRAHCWIRTKYYSQHNFSMVVFTSTYFGTTNLHRALLYKNYIFIYLFIYM